MADGTKSTDHELKKKKKAKSEVKPTGKKSESAIKGKKPVPAKSDKDAAKGGKKVVAGKSKKSDDDLDIESEASQQSESLEASD